MRNSGLQEIARPRDKSHWTETVVKVAGPARAAIVSRRRLGKLSLAPAFFHAGIRHPDARLVYYGAKTLLPLALAGLAYMAMRGLNQSSSLTLLLYVLLAALIGCYLPNLVLHLAIRSRQREIFETFPTRPT